MLPASGTMRELGRGMRPEKDPQKEGHFPFQPRRNESKRKEVQVKFDRGVHMLRKILDNR